MLDTFVVETTPIILTRELDRSFAKRTCDEMTLFREVGYGYVSRPDGEKVTPSWLKEGNYQIESRGRKYEVGFDQKFGFTLNTDFKLTPCLLSKLAHSDETSFSRQHCI